MACSVTFNELPWLFRLRPVFLTARFVLTADRPPQVEYDAEFAGRARRAVAEAGLEDRVAVLHANVLDVDFLKDATCCFVYLVPKGMKLIADRLKQLAEGKGRVVTYVFSVPGKRQGGEFTTARSAAQDQKRLAFR